MTRESHTTEHSSILQAGSTPGQWTAVVAVAENGVIGRGDQLPWRLSSDLKRFKLLTMGQCLLMGRKTFQSIGKPLPGRQTIVLSRQLDLDLGTGVQVARRLDDVSKLVEPARAVMVVGGAEIYRVALELCSQIWITRVKAVVDGDTFFPAIDWSKWSMFHCESFDSGDKDQLPTDFQKWCRSKT